MAKRVIETVVFKLNDGVSRTDFVAAAQAVNSFVAAQPGFIARRLSCGADGEWVDHVEWADMSAAQAAADNISQVEDNRPFLAAIDGRSVIVRHTELEVSVS